MVEEESEARGILSCWRVLKGGVGGSMRVTARVEYVDQKSLEVEMEVARQTCSFLEIRRLPSLRLDKSKYASRLLPSFRLQFVKGFFTFRLVVCDL